MLRDTQLLVLTVRLLFSSRLTQSAHLITSIPAILVIAWLASRLLGVKHSWLRVIVSGFLGWLAAVGLSLVLTNDQPQSVDFTRDVYVFAIVLTMLASVLFELVAQPSALAGSAPTRIPRPLSAVRLWLRRLLRYFQLTRIAARHGLGPYLGIGRHEHDEELDSPSGLPHRITHALEDCGGMFVKLGQVLSTRRDLLPASFINELSHLQDRVSPEDPKKMRELLEAELGRPVRDAFAEIDWQPIAAASIGQAYRGRLHSGEEVVVKVQRPGIAEAVERDIQVLLQLARSVESRAPWARDYQVVQFAEEFSDRLREELDFRIEARNTVEIAANMAATPELAIPAVHQELSSTKVLVLEWLDGVSVRRTAEIETLGHDRAKLAEILMRTGVQQMLIDGVFHADPHPGNVMVLRDGRVGLIDFGAVSRLDAMQQSSLREMMVAISRRDAGLLRRGVLEVATLRRRFDDEQLERALARFIARRLGAGAVPNAAMFNELLQLFFTFGITLPPEFGTFFRALVTLEGTLTILSPGYLMIDAAQKLAEEWAKERMAPASLNELARKEVISLAPILRRLPTHLDRIATIIERRDLTARVSLFSEEADVRLVTRLANRAILTALGGITGVVAVLFLGMQGGPPFAGGTTLFHFFGYSTLFCSAVLVMRVVVAVLHDGLN
jgi:ubiquinone biosynthesis protein